MGSSVSGSLDKFAKISPAAALGSGKVKLPGGPMGGIAGMVQEDMIGRAEAKQAQNAANMQMMQQQQNQQNQYNMALQQMMMGQQRPSLYSPAPYANGGNVALRRKMFKLGGSASAHGTGLTSGLSFKQGGQVPAGVGSGMNPKVQGPDGKMRESHFLGTVGKGLLSILLPGARTAAKVGAKPFTKTGRKDIADIVNYYRTYPRDSVTDIFNTIRRNKLKTALGTTAGASLAGQTLFGGDVFGGMEDDAETLGDFAKQTFTEMGRYPRVMTEGYIPAIKDALAAETVGEGLSDLFLGTGEEYEKYYEDLYGEKPGVGESIKQLFGAGEEPDAVNVEDYISRTDADIDLQAEMTERAAEARQAAFEDYQRLIAGEDNTNKLMTLGSALTGAGAALMEGEGYGAAAEAFNEPLQQAMAEKRAQDTAVTQAAAELAITEDISRRAADDEALRQMMLGGDFSDLEQAQRYQTAIAQGVSQRVPEDDKGNLDQDALLAQPGVFSDPKNITMTNKLYAAVNSAGTPIFTNDVEEARAHASS
jgi:hypothetical protein